MSNLTRRVVTLAALFTLFAGSLTAVATELRQRAVSDSTPRERIADEVRRDSEGRTTIRLATGAFDPLKKEPAVPDGLRASSPRRWLVQVDYPATRAVRESIAATGARFVGSLPDVTYLVEADAAVAQRVRGLAGVRWVGAFHPAYKLSPSLADLAGTQRIRVWWHEGVDGMRVGASLARAGVEVRELRSRVAVVEAGPASFRRLAAIDDVVWIDRAQEYKLHNANALWVTDTGERDNLAATAPGRLDGKGQTAAVADTGINYIPDDNGRAQRAFSDCNAAGECKLADFVSVTAGSSTTELASTKATGSGHRKMAGYFNLDADDPNARSLEGSWHGTHVSGSVAADYPDDAGAYGTRSREADGIAVGARLTFQDIEADGGLGGLPGSPYDLFQQVYDLDKDGQYDPLEDARTHNNSYGAIYPELDDGGGHDTDAFVHEHPDMTIVFSASNDGPAPATLAGGPQESKNVITSCASANGRQPLVSPDAAAIFSSHGPTLDGRIKPDVCTPGQVNVSPKGGTVDQDQYLQGTSMSGPMLVGLVTLVRQYFWDGFGPNGSQGFARGTRDFGNRHNPSAALVKAVTINSAQRMRGWYTGDDGDDRAQDGMWPSNGQGWGKVELDKALYFPGDDRALYTVDRPSDATSGIETGNDVTEFIDVAPGQPLDVTLTWTDPPAALPAGTPLLVNDLDLVVTAPDGTEYLGNEFTTQSPTMGPGGDPAADVGESVSGGLADSNNNVEGVRLAAPKPGRYQVTVRGTNVAEGPQGYALAVSGRIATDSPRIVFDAPKYKTGAKATAYLLGTGLSGDTVGGFTKLAPSIYVQEVTASGAAVSVSGGGATGSAPVDDAGPVSSTVVVDSRTADLARVTWTTDERTIGEVVITGPAGEEVFTDVYNVETFKGIDSRGGETKGTYLNRKVLSTSHEVFVTGLKPGVSYRYTIRSTDEAGNVGAGPSGSFESTAAMYAPRDADIAALVSGDTTTGAPLTPDINACGVSAPVSTCQPWGKSTQLYAGSTEGQAAAVESMPAFMFRLPSSVDPSKITGAAVELHSGHDVVDVYTDDPVYSLDLLDSGAEDGWGPGKTYTDVKGAEADVQMAADVTLHRGANTPYTWHVPCNQLEAFKTNLSEDSGDERRAAFRLEANTTLPDSLFSFETGYGRRSRGPHLRPRLVVFMDGLDPMPCTATAAPQISSVAVDQTTETSAVVSWRTDVPADSTVYFRKPGSGEAGWVPVSAPVRTTQHFVSIQGLEKGGAYEFVVRSATCNGLETTDTNGGKSYAIDAGAFQAPVVGSIAARPDPDEPGTEVVTWGSDQETTSVIRYGTSPSSLDKEVVDDVVTDSHELEVTGLAPCTRYYFRVGGKNDAGREASSELLAFETPPAALNQVVSFDFESGEQGWTNDPAGGTGTVGVPLVGGDLTPNPTTWERENEPAIGSFAMRTVNDLGPGYSSNTDQRLVSPPIAVPAGYSIIEFTEWFNLEGVFGEQAFEQPIVEVMIDGSWIRLREAIASQNPDFPDPTTTRLVLPSEAAGKSIRLGFRLRSDTNLEQPGGGWAVDDVKVLSAQCGSVANVDPSVPLAPTTSPVSLTEQPLRVVPGPLPPADGSGAPIGRLAALSGAPSTEALAAGTCRCTDIRYLGQQGAAAGGGQPAPPAGQLPATGGPGALLPAAGALLVALAIRRRRTAR